MAASEGMAADGRYMMNAAEVAAALDEYINASDYVDFDYTGIYEDYDVEVKMGIQNGEPYMEENEMEDIDFEEML